MMALLENPSKSDLINTNRDQLLTDFGRATLEDRYLLPGESFQDLFYRVASYYADDEAHARRLYDYISKLWFMPATPILSNGGTTRGLPISCYLNTVGDSLDDISDTWNENVWLAARGGGIGTNWSHVRSIGERVGIVGQTSGIIPFIRVMDSLTLAISQGSLRRGSSAVYLHVSHPEIEEFIEIRRPTGGDPNRKSLNLHNAIIVDDKFMHAVENDESYDLISPATGEKVREVRARDLWIKMITCRLETGEPYLLFIDTVRNATPEHHKALNLYCDHSNLGSEITLFTGQDHLGHQRTAVCCLSSLNLETYDEWKDDQLFVEDVMRFLDNVLTDFIKKTEGQKGFENARYAAMRERSVGLGVMGLHSFFQSKQVPFESAMAKAWNLNIFRNLKQSVDAASIKLGKERGPCPDAAESGSLERFSYKMAIAPTASISIICGGASPGIEPIVSNSFIHKTLSGSFTVRNQHLKKLLIEKNKDTSEVWADIHLNHGSVQHLDFLTDDEKAIFKTAFELDQRWIIDLAADRAPYICQAQSVNIFLPANIHKRDLNQLHMMAWKKGLKSLYYCRSLSLQRVETAIPKPNHVAGEDECLSCQ